MVEIDNLRRAGKWQDVEASCHERLRLNCEDVEAWFLLSEALGNQKHYAVAKEAALRAVNLDPSCYQGWHHLANNHSALGEWAQCQYAAQRVLQIAPNAPYGHWLLAHASMFTGEWRQAWASYEYGELIGKRFARCVGERWHGQKLKESDVLFVYGEQGAGDEIQYARYLKTAEERAGCLTVFECKPHLSSLMGLMHGATIPAPPDKMTTCAFTHHVPLMSLPHALGLTDRHIACDPYIKIDQADEVPGKIGFVWKGSSVHANDANRSLPPEIADYLYSQIEGAVSFQVGVETDIIPHAHFMDFAATARALSGIEILVTVDTSTAHLAGAMGIETIVLAPLNFTEPRWGGSENTDWYDSWTVLHGTTFEELAGKCLERLELRKAGGNSCQTSIS